MTQFITRYLDKRAVACLSRYLRTLSKMLSSGSVGIDLKELRGRGSAAEMFEILPGIEVYGRFSLKNERL